MHSGSVLLNSSETVELLKTKFITDQTRNSISKGLPHHIKVKKKYPRSFSTQIGTITEELSENKSPSPAGWRNNHIKTWLDFPRGAVMANIWTSIWTSGAVPECMAEVWRKVKAIPLDKAPKADIEGIHLDDGFLLTTDKAPNVFEHEHSPLKQAGV